MYKITTITRYINKCIVLEECNLEKSGALHANSIVKIHPPPINIPCFPSKPIDLCMTVFVQQSPQVTPIQPRSYLVVPLPDNALPEPTRPIFIASDQVNAITILNVTSVDIDVLLTNITAFYKYLHAYGSVCIDPTSPQFDPLAELYAHHHFPPSTQPATSHTPKKDAATQTTGPPQQQQQGKCDSFKDNALFVILPTDPPLRQFPIFVKSYTRGFVAITIFNALSINIDVLGENIARNYDMLCVSLI